MTAANAKMFELANRPAGVTCEEFAEAAGIAKNNASVALSSGLKSGRLFKVRPPAGVTHYFADNSVATAWALESHIAGPEVQAPGPTKQSELARQAIRTFTKNAICSSVQLAHLCGSTAAAIDQAFDPLVAAGKLQRVPTQRAGVDMFTYRFSALWVPKDEDFQFADAPATPKAGISPVAPPKLKAKPAPAPAPIAASPAPQTRTVASAPASAPAQAPASAVDLALTHANTLGFRDTTEPTVAPDTLDVLVGDLESSLIEASDLVLAINSRGEFVIDLGQGDLVRFPPAQALQLKRFLVNTTVLECLEVPA